MTFEEKNVWVYAVVSVVAFGAYVVIILGRAEGAAITEVPYVGTMLWTIGAAIVASISASPCALERNQASNCDGGR